MLLRVQTAMRVGSRVRLGVVVVVHSFGLTKKPRWKVGLSSRMGCSTDGLFGCLTFLCVMTGLEYGGKTVLIDGQDGNRA